MGNDGSHISTEESTSSSAGTSSTFNMMRQLSYESDVFYPDMKPHPGMAFEKPGVPNLTPNNFPVWRTGDINPMLLKYMKRSYKPCPETLKASAKKLAELSAAQKIPKFVTSFGGSQCVKLHWACLAGWCMCRYQYQPMTPLHLMPHTRLTSNNVIRKGSVTPDSHDDSSNSSVVSSASDVVLNASSEKLKLYDDTMPAFHTEDSDVTTKAVMDFMRKETTV